MTAETTYERRNQDNGHGISSQENPENQSRQTLAIQLPLPTYAKQSHRILRKDK